MEPAPPRARLVAVALAVCVLGVFGQVRGHGFVDYDDGEYVYENPQVRAGLSLDGVAWAFTTNHAANWHPLTWLSHMADVELFGLDPHGHHVVAALLHALNAVLLFLVLRSATGTTWRSAAVAALFAIHPLHVESVAWVAERKDVLSGTFFILTIGAYVRWARAPGAGRCAAVLVTFALGLLAKPMGVTLPFVLLLLDVWPLGRAGKAAWRRLVAEKVPLLALAAASCWLTIAAQASMGATASAESFPIGARLGNAAIAYVAYLAKAVWPAGLAMFYPHPASFGETLSVARVAGALALLCAITGVAVWQLRSRPYVLVGWLWYLGTLVPAIGIVQVGSQSMADRYTYLPLTGVFAAIAWTLHDLCARTPLGTRVLSAASAAALVALAAAAHVQVGYWRDPPSLYGHAIAVTERNFVAWNNLGIYHLGRGELVQAKACFEQSIVAKNDHAIAYYNLGVTLGQMGNPVAAIVAYRETVRLDPEYLEAWVNMGILSRGLGDLPAAIASLRRALQVRSDHAVAAEQLVLAALQQGDRRGAAEALRVLSAASPRRAAEVIRAVPALRAE